MNRYEVKWYWETVGKNPMVIRSLVTAETPEQAAQEILKRQCKDPFKNNDLVFILHVMPILHPSKFIYSIPIGSRILT